MWQLCSLMRHTLILYKIVYMGNSTKTVTPGWKKKFNLLDLFSLEHYKRMYIFMFMIKWEKVRNND